MARVFGAQATVSIAGMGTHDTDGYGTANCTIETDMEVNNTFGDSLTDEQMIRGMKRCRGDFEAFYDSTFTAAELVSMAPGDTSDGTITLRFDGTTADKGFTFSAILENMTVAMTRTGFHRVRGSFRSSGNIAAVAIG